MNRSRYIAWTNRRIDLLRRIVTPARLDVLASALDLLDEEFGVVGGRILKAPPREARKAPHRNPWIQGIYAIGSAGTASATIRSDVDVWLVVDGRTEAERAALRRAGGHLEAWAGGRGVEIRFFVHEARDVAAMRFPEDKEGAEAFGPVLAEEFFRTCLWLGGRPPAWWVEDEGGPRHERPIDLGAPRRGPDETYLAAALLQIEKAIERPFKSILKIAALGACAEGRLARLPAEAVRARAEAGEETDPYLALVEAVWEASEGDPAARRAFGLVKDCLYLKGVVEEETPGRIGAWRERLVEAGYAHVGPRADLADLDAFLSWPLDRRLALARSVLGHLREALAALSGRAPGAAGWARETARALARRIEARQGGPGRIERLSALDLPATGDVFTVSPDGPHWAITIGPGRPGGGSVLRKAAGPVEALAFLVANDLAAPGRTQVRFLPASAGVRRVPDLVRRLVRLVSTPPRPEAFAADEAPAEALLVWTRPDLRDPAADHVVRLVRTSWGCLVLAAFDGVEAAASGLASSIGGPPCDVHVDFPGPAEEVLAEVIRVAAADPPGAARLLDDLPRRLVVAGEEVGTARDVGEVLDLLAAPGVTPRPAAAPPVVRALVAAIDEAPRPALLLVDAEGAARIVAVDEDGRWHVWPAAPADLPHLGASVFRFAEAAGVRPAVFTISRRRGREEFDRGLIDPAAWRLAPPECDVAVETDESGAPRLVRVADISFPAEPGHLAEAAAAIRRLRKGRQADYPIRVTRVRTPRGAPAALGRLLAARREAERELEAAWRRYRRSR